MALNQLSIVSHDHDIKTYMKMCCCMLLRVVTTSAFILFCELQNQEF